MGFEPFYILDALTQTLKRFGLWKSLPKQQGQEYTEKYYVPGAVDHWSTCERSMYDKQ